MRGERRFLLRPLDETQRTYLHALDVSPAVFTEMGSGAGLWAARKREPILSLMESEGIRL
jgi:hypothetical protein